MKNFMLNDAVYFSRQAPKERNQHQEEYQHKAKSSKPKDRKPDYSKQRQSKRMEILY